MEENYFSKSHPSRDLCRTDSWLTGNDGWAKAAQLRLLECHQSENNTVSSQTSAPQSAGLATEPFFESYRGSSLMPKETASPQQLTGKGDTWRFGNHMNVYTGKWTPETDLWCFLKVKTSGRKEGEKCCWKQDHLEWTAGLNPKQTGGWSCKWRPQSRTQGLVSLQKLNIS